MTEVPGQVEDSKFPQGSYLVAGWSWLVYAAFLAKLPLYGCLWE